MRPLFRFLTVLRALFRPPQSTRVQKVVAPLLDAEEEVLREKAAGVLGKVRSIFAVVVAVGVDAVIAVAAG